MKNAAVAIPPARSGGQSQLPSSVGMWLPDARSGARHASVALSVAEPRYSRRLFSHLLSAFHQACDGGALRTAGQLLVVLEDILAGAPDGTFDDLPRKLESLVAAHHRFWDLRHPRKPLSEQRRLHLG
jgi:hypothetical protein